MVVGVLQSQLSTSTKLVFFQRKRTPQRTIAVHMYPFFTWHTVYTRWIPTSSYQMWINTYVYPLLILFIHGVHVFKVAVGRKFGIPLSYLKGTFWNTLFLDEGRKFWNTPFLAEGRKFWYAPFLAEGRNFWNTPFLAEGRKFWYAPFLAEGRKFWNTFPWRESFGMPGFHGD